VRAYGNSAVAAAAATEATCVLDIVVTRRCRAHFCVPRGAWPPRGGRQFRYPGNRGQFSLESCSEPNPPLIKPLQSYPSLWRSVFLLLQFSKLYWHVQDHVHTNPSREPGPPSSQSASEAQLHNLRNPLRRPRRLRADGRRRREARSAFGAAGDELLGARAAAVAIAVRGVRGHSDHAVLDADRHRGRRPAHMWDAVFALGAVDAFCVLGAGCVVAEGESEVSRRAYWRAPRRERKRSHSTPPSRDDGGVERRQCRGAQQLASRLE
jgi:hypothetical protein